MKQVQVGVCLLTAYAVFAFGAVDPLSQVILELGAAALLLVWTLRTEGRRHIQIRWNWLYLPFLGLCCVAIGQYTVGFTAYPYSTKIELLKLGTYLFLSFLAQESIQTEAERNRFAWFLAILAFAVSLLGILEFFTSNGKVLWVRMVVNAGPGFGTFVDRDHFAGFVELTGPFAFAMLLSGAVRRDMRPLACLLGIVPVGAVVLSGSRGGILSLCFELGLLGVLLGRRIIRSERGYAALLLALCGVFAAWLGTEGAVGRFQDLASSGVTNDKRMSMYKDTWRSFADHIWIGTGLGTLQFVYPRYESQYDGYIVEHAHNDYLELLADTGIAGGICGIAFLVLLFKQGFSNLRKATTPSSLAFHSGALAASSGLLLHSAVDFNLHIPSNALLFFLTAFTSSAPVLDPGGPQEEIDFS